MLNIEVYMTWKWERIQGKIYDTTHAKTNAIAKSDPPKPSCKPTAVAKAVTVDEWDDGIPPDPTNCFRFQCFSLYL